ncbi:hypothetical protein OKW41_006162 [Paraburkholderia sp. UCT70]
MSNHDRESSFDFELNRGGVKVGARSSDRFVTFMLGLAASTAIVLGGVAVLSVSQAYASRMGSDS